MLALQANATITSGAKPGAFNENPTGTDDFINFCGSATTYTLTDTKAAVVYTTGPIGSGAQL